MKFEKCFFISYKTEDIIIANQFIKLLNLIFDEFLSNEHTNNYFKTFLSAQNINSSDHWFSLISKELDSSSVIICLLSKRSFKSPWVLFEAGAGLTSKRTYPITFNLSDNELQGNPFQHIEHKEITGSIYQLLEDHTPLNIKSNKVKSFIDEKIEIFGILHHPPKQVDSSQLQNSKDNKIPLPLKVI